jgi:hypothetical protein
VLKRQILPTIENKERKEGKKQETNEEIMRERKKIIKKEPKNKTKKEGRK